jgi:uncharacterized protein with HEPN domain
MRASEGDRVRLQHMLEAIEQLERRAKDLTQEKLDEDPMLRMAAVKFIEIIGEAATRVSEEMQAANPEVPWSVVIGMRNKLVHDYFHIDTAIVAEVIKEHLPKLKAKIMMILGKMG